ncbi:MAG: hypothetical protein GIX03_06840 [Candidatus Eremiobacteraeota bacterium]|nr:hypothetical protein [Candidatus Eremiobacteraeota bacterium]
MPETLVAALKSELSSVPNVTVTIDRTGVCGFKAEHLIATGIADSADRRNIDVYAFRENHSLYTLLYTFKEATLPKDADSSLTMLCPPSNSPPSAPAPAASTS